MVWILAIAALSLVVSFLCSLFEAALYTITPSQVEVLRARRAFGAERLAKLRAHVEESIAAILTLDTITDTVGPALCGGLVAEYYGDAAIGLFAGIFTIMILIVGEMVPKTLGVRYATTLAPKLAWPLQCMVWLSWPVARAARGLVQGFLPVREVHSPSIDEIVMLSRLARQGGKLRAQELRVVENALRLHLVSARDLMTPRTVVDSLPADLPIADIKRERRVLARTRVLLIENDNPDALVGVVHSKDVFRSVLQGDLDKRLRDLARPIECVPESMTGARLLEKFIKQKRHMVAVLDEHGGFEGIVTLEDVLECLLGSEIVDEHDRHVDMQQVARQRAAARIKQLATERGSAG